MFSLRLKFTLALVLVAILGVATVAVVANRVTTREFTLYVRAGGSARVQRLAAEAGDVYASTGGWDAVAPVMQDAVTTQHPGQGAGAGHGQGPQGAQGAQGAGASALDRIVIVDVQGRVVVDTAGELVGQPMPADDQSTGVPIEASGQQVGTLLLTSQDLSGRSPLEQQFLDAANRALIWASALVSAVALVGAAVLSRQLVGPLHKLTVASEAMATGDLSQRVEVHTRDEVEELAHAFNAMARDLEAAEVQRQQMTADIAHELRNPLSVIRGNLEAMLDGVYPADVEHLGPIYEETILLQRLVQDLRLLSLADAGQLQLVLTEVDLLALLSGIADSVQAVADDREVEIRLDLPVKPLVVEGDADRLRQVVGNLLSNALRYTPAGGRVTLRAWETGGRARIQVSDTGPGIAPKDLPHVFDRFYRAGTARDRASGGSGLGLAIVRALVEAHGGEIEVASLPGEGATFTIVLGQQVKR
ncbi:MAG: sensor histidine kinase [Anaerolineae bacterium]|jgi:signal transduction histidine kinase